VQDKFQHENLRVRNLLGFEIWPSLLIFLYILAQCCATVILYHFRDNIIALVCRQIINYVTSNDLKEYFECTVNVSRNL